ncbi:hypothetical protein CHS0354_020106 [Potamilus streckersoni]|uniref:Ubiquitin-like domain-containing protein n=1 Tax=Potamilus streckersoni TaxID=2493646 RepID=A0AAE0S590_9BIVA|nr:hypothetical protein CHS0354_020106 [Potamilus streckersoni]
MATFEHGRPLIQRDLVPPMLPRRFNYNHGDYMDSDSDLDSNESSESIADYIDIDFNGVVGRAIAVWSYKKQDNITLFTPIPDDTLYRIVKFAEDQLGFNRKDEKIMVLGPGEKEPKEIKDVYSIKPGCVVMIMPRSNVTVMVEINQLKEKFPIIIDPFATVFQVKSYIKKVKGIPIDQQDLLYRDKPMENCRRMFEYHLREKATLHVLIQVTFSLLINVETFWGKSYRLYTDHCNTGSDIIYRIFGRTFSKYGPEQVSAHELYIPIHVLILQYQHKSFPLDYCLGHFNIRNGDTIIITTVGKESKLNMQVVKVITEMGDKYDIHVSQFDRWSVVAFMLHGVTDVPVDLIRLYKDKTILDLTSVIGEVSQHSVIMMNIMMVTIDNDLMFGIPIKIALGNGIIENIKMVPSKKVGNVKSKLQKLGVPNATLYELVIDDHKLPNAIKLQDVIQDLRAPIHLKVEKFPIFVHGTDGTIYKTSVHVNQTFGSLKQKLSMKTGQSMSNCHFMISGQEFIEPDSVVLYDCGITTRTSIFLQTKSHIEVFYIYRANWLVKLKIPIKPTGTEIKKCIWDNKDIPEGSITCLQTLMFWYFYPRVSKKNQLPRKRASKKRIPPATLPLLPIVDRKPRKVGFPDQDKLLELMEDRDIKTVRWKKLEAGEGVDDKGGLGGGNPSKTSIIKPQNQQKGHDDETRTWPITIQEQHKHDVEAWITSGRYDRNKGQHVNLYQHPTMHSIQRETIRTKKPKKIEVIHNIPRWMNNLLKKYDEHRLVVSEDHVGAGYRKRSKTQEPWQPSKKVVEVKPHIQGDATTGRFLQHHLSYENQQFMYLSTDSETEDDDYSDVSQSRTKTLHKHR